MPGQQRNLKTDRMEEKTMKNVLARGTVLRRGKRPYEIVKVLGAGGFGITYLAKGKVENITMNFAVKEFFMGSLCEREGSTMCYSKPVSDDVEAGKRSFLAEARRLSGLGVAHDNLVCINEAFEENNTAYYVMEYVAGKSMRQHFTHPFGEEEALKIMKPVLSALSKLHANRITHLDIKPDNILLKQEDDGTVRPVITDFGLSKHYNQKGSATSQVHLLACSPGYAPLEQYSTTVLSQFTPQIDVYAAAATLFYLLTGKDPKEAAEISRSWIEQELQPVASEGTRSAILAAMRKDKDDRTGSIAEFAKRLGLEIGGSHGGTVMISSEKRHTISIDWRGIWKKAALPLAACAAVALGVIVVQNVPSCSKSSGELIAEDTTAADSSKVVATDISKFVETSDNVKSETASVDVVQLVEVAQDVPKKEEKLVDKKLAVGLKTKFSNGLKPRWSRRITVAQGAVLENLVAKMVKVKGGTFTMGATAEQGSDPSDDEKPAHRVTLSDYYIGKYEVTQAEWEAVMGEKPTSDGYNWTSEYGIGGNYPAYYISWNDCDAFIRKLNEMTGLNFKLPTEAQWEFAARGGNKSRGYKFSGGDYIDRSGRKTHPVGDKQANELGLHDMSGNVYEWCSDRYGKSYYSSSPQLDPIGPGSGLDRVLRGGSWLTALVISGGSANRVTSRYHSAVTSRYNSHGMRLAL